MSINYTDAHTETHKRGGDIRNTNILLWCVVCHTVPIGFPGFDSDEKWEPAEGRPLGVALHSQQHLSLSSFPGGEAAADLNSEQPRETLVLPRGVEAPGPVRRFSTLAQLFTVLVALKTAQGSTPASRSQSYLGPVPGDPNPWSPQAPDTHGPRMWYTHMYGT